MAQSSFRRDMARSEEAVYAVMMHLKNSGRDIRELEGKEEQTFGDLRCLDGDKENIEVKFDIMAGRTGNLCFEMSNGKKLTGILTTKADFVYYVVPSKEGKRVYIFKTSKLVDFVQNSPRIKVKNGGDKKKFILGLAKIEDIVEDEIPEKVFDLA